MPKFNMAHENYSREHLHGCTAVWRNSFPRKGWVWALKHIISVCRFSRHTEQRSQFYGTFGRRGPNFKAQSMLLSPQNDSTNGERIRRSNRWKKEMQSYLSESELLLGDITQRLEPSASHAFMKKRIPRIWWRVKHLRNLLSLSRNTLFNYKELFIAFHQIGGSQQLTVMFSCRRMWFSWFILLFRSIKRQSVSFFIKIPNL